MLKNLSKKKLVVINGIVILIPCLYYLLTAPIFPISFSEIISKNSEEKFLVSIKCPNEYDSEGEYKKSIENFFGYYVENYPNITEKELMQKRNDWFMSHQCEGYPELVECVATINKQDKDLENDVLADSETFEKYKVDEVFNKQLADLDVNSNKFAKNFRTAIRTELAESGINFSGHYSIVSVGMTGWGENYFIVDRSNGKAYPFPYQATFLEFSKYSNLIVMNPKHMIIEDRKNRDYFDACSSTGAIGFYYTDARPFYFLWENNTLKFIGPKDAEPPITILSVIKILNQIEQEKN